MRPSEVDASDVRFLTDEEAPGFLETHKVALLAFLDMEDAVSLRMRERVGLVAMKWRAAGPAHGTPAAIAGRGHSFGAGVVDVTRHRLVASALGVRSVPAVILFEGGVVVDRLLGAAPESVLDDMVATRMRRA